VGGQLVEGDLVVDGGRVAAVGSRPAGRGGVACPGFVDVQVNGFAGVECCRADDDGYRHAAAALARTGVTAWLPTIPTAAPERYAPALGAARRAQRAAPAGARVLGVHLEGPFLSARRAGAHPRQHLRMPDLDLADRFLAAGPVALVTVAPELPGATELIAHLVARGVVVSLGHTDAEEAAARAAFDAGARAVTHLWNAQRPMTGRDAAVGGVALARGDVFVGVIADLVHVGADTLRVSAAAAGDRLVLDSDAAWVAGLPEGEYAYDERTVRLAGGAVRLADGTLAGSAATLADGVRNLSRLGVPLARALVAATGAPARLLGRRDVGRLDVGAAADAVLLDDELEVRRVLVGGVEVHAA
jgi:N-acetylglucosamine-6-phosphate deacetylase